MSFNAHDHYVANRDKILAQRKAFQKANPEHIKAQRRESDKIKAIKHPELLAARRRNWASRNRDKLREKGRLWRESHPGYFAEMARKTRANPESNANIKTNRRLRYKKNIDKMRFQARESYRRNKSSKLDGDRKYRLNNIEKVRDRLKAWRQKNQARCNAYGHVKRARKRQCTVNTHSINIFLEGSRNKKWVVCYYCGVRIAGKDCHFDHILPLAKGGPHSIENLCVSCPSCNLRKHSKFIQDWMRLGQQILAL